MRGVTVYGNCIFASTDISTRTPHAGSDACVFFAATCTEISTRTPHAGSDQRTRDEVRGLDIFQPALPMRGVTLMETAYAVIAKISTRTPHAGSDSTTTT